MAQDLAQLLKQRSLFNNPRVLGGQGQVAAPGIVTDTGDGIDELVAEQLRLSGEAPDADFTQQMDELNAEGVDVPALLVGPGGRKENEVRSFEPGAMRQIGIMAKELRALGADDSEIMSTVRRMRMKQLTSRGDKKKFSILTNDEIADLELPKGTLAQRDESTGRLSIVKSPRADTVNSRERVMRKLASGEGVITPGEQDVLLLNIQDIIQRDDVAQAVKRHNARLRSGGALNDRANLQPAPRNPAARVKGQRYTNPKDPNDILLWDGQSFIRE